MPKPLFERDFFDMTEEVNLPVLPSSPATTPLVESPVEDTSVPDFDAGTTSQQPVIDSNQEAGGAATPSVIQGKPGKKGKAGKPGNTPQPEIPLLPTSTIPASKSTGRHNVRQTFVLEESYMERIRDYVHARRSQGDYHYSQKQLIEEALDLRLASQEPAPPRPAELREQEQQLRVRIQQGRHASATPKHSNKQPTTDPQMDDDE